MVKNDIIPVVSIRFLRWRNRKQRLSLHQIALSLQLQFQLNLYRASRKKKCLFHLSHSPEHRLFLPLCHLQSAPTMNSKLSILPTVEALSWAQSSCVQAPPPPVICVALIPTACCRRTR